MPQVATTSLNGHRRPSASDGWQPLADRRSRAFGQAVAAADDILAEPGRGLQGGRLHQAVGRVRQGRRARTRRSATLRLLRLLPRAALRHRRGAAGHPARTPSRAGRRRRRSSTRTQPPRYVLHGARTSAPGASPRPLIASGRRIIFLLRCCSLLHRREQPGGRQPPCHHAERGARTAWPQEREHDGPVPRRSSCCSCWRIVFGAWAASWHRRLLARSGRPTAAKAAPYECGIVPSRGAARALPGQLLPGGDAVHHVRHRDRVPVPVRGVARRSSGSYGFWAILVFSVVFFAAFVYEVAKGGLDWGPMPAPRAASSCRPCRRRTHHGEHDPPGRHSKAAASRPSRARRPEMGVQTSATRASRASATTSSRRASKTWCSGRGPARRGRSRSGWRAAPSR